MNFYYTKPFIIADLGSTWNRSASEEENLHFCVQAIKAVRDAGCNAVKFQLYTHEELYGFKGDDKYALPREWLSILAREANSHDLEFMCTPFSVSGLKAVDEFVNIHKLASCEFTHHELLLAIAQTNKPVVISTGSCNQLEVLDTIKLWQDLSSNDICVLECVASYPAAPTDYHLQALISWKESAAVGISDHTLTSSIALTSIGFGAQVFEKHFDAFKDMGYGKVPDSPVSIGPEAMKRYTEDINHAFNAIRNGFKKPVDAEKEIYDCYRRRPIALRAISNKEVYILNDNYGCYRGSKSTDKISPLAVDIHGRIAKRDIPKGDPIGFDDIV